MLLLECSTLKKIKSEQYCYSLPSLWHILLVLHVYYYCYYYYYYHHHHNTTTTQTSSSACILLLLLLLPPPPRLIVLNVYYYCYYYYYYYYHHHHHTTTTQTSTSACILLLPPSSSIMMMSLDTGLFFLVLLLNHWWSPLLRVQVSDSSTSDIVCHFPSIAVFCSVSIECLLGMAFKFYFKPFVTTLVAAVVTGIIIHFMFHIHCTSVHQLLYFNFYCCTVHFDMCRVHSPTNSLFNLKNTLKYT